MKPRHLLVALLAFAVVIPAAQADMYQWTDSSGVIHFSDHAGDPSAVKVDQDSRSTVTETASPLSPSLSGERHTASAGTTVKALLLFDGRPLSALADFPASFSVYDEDLKMWTRPPADYDNSTGTCLLKISGNARLIDVRASRDSKEPYRPGDFKGQGRTKAGLVSQQTVTIDMEKVLHLTAPEDNASSLPDTKDVCGNRVEFQAPLRIAWDAMGEGVGYRYAVYRQQCEPYAVKGTVLEETTTSALVGLDLPPSKDGEYYSLRITAYKNGKIIGSLMTHGGSLKTQGKNWWGWDYRFRVVPQPGPSKVISPGGR